MTLTGISGGTPQTFHFFYLGSNPPAVTSDASSVEVSFAEQTGLRENLGSCHVGYGSANGTVTNGVVTGINVTLVSKVALARFSFKKGSADYTDALTLSGDNIYNSMTVGFGGSFNHGETPGSISLTGSHSERYVMLVPTGAAAEQTLTFTGSAESGTGTVPGLESNKFYGKTDAIPVSLAASQPTSIGTFTVSSGVTVSFSPGNLYAKKTGTEWEWGFYEHQYDMNSLNSGGSRTATSADAEIDLFTWGYGTWSTDPVGTTYQEDAFTDWGKAPGLPDAGEGKTWRTLTNNEWVYLLNTYNASSGARTDVNRFAKAKVNGVCGLLIFPDGYTLPSGYTTEGGGTGMAKVNKTSSSDAPWPDADIPTETWTSMETAGVVFLPAAGYRIGTDVYYVGSIGYYWSSAPDGSNYAYYMSFSSGYVRTDSNYRDLGCSFRLVRSAS